MSASVDNIIMYSPISLGVLSASINRHPPLQAKQESPDTINLKRHNYLGAHRPTASKSEQEISNVIRKMQAGINPVLGNTLVAMEWQALDGIVMNQVVKSLEPDYERLAGTLHFMTCVKTPNGKLQILGLQFFYSCSTSTGFYTLNEHDGKLKSIEGDKFKGISQEIEQTNEELAARRFTLDLIEDTPDILTTAYVVQEKITQEFGIKPLVFGGIVLEISPDKGKAIYTAKEMVVQSYCKDIIVNNKVFQENERHKDGQTKSLEKKKIAFAQETQRQLRDLDKPPASKFLQKVLNFLNKILRKDKTKLQLNKEERSRAKKTANSINTKLTLWEAYNNKNEEYDKEWGKRAAPGVSPEGPTENRAKRRKLRR